MINIISFPSRIKTFGNSMMPILRDGDIVYLRKINFRKININDIICVKKGSRVFTHRVIYKAEKYLITKGDSNLFSDGKIYPKNIIGTVYKIKRDTNIFGIDDLYLLQSTLYFQEIVKVNNGLEKSNINFVILKGLPLHMFFEESHPKRLYADCDILISRKQFSKVGKILEKLGYSSEDSLSVTGRELVERVEVSFYKMLNGVPIVFDVHLEVVFMMTKIDKLNILYPEDMINRLTEKFIDEKKEINIQGEKFPILSAENLFIYLLLHLFHHNFKGTYRYDLIKKIISFGKIDFQLAASTINYYFLGKFIYPSFILLREFYGVSFPKDFLESIHLSSSEKERNESRVKKINIFDDFGRLEEGKERFKNAFFFSPYPFYKKSLALFRGDILYAILLVFIVKIKVKARLYFVDKKI